MNLIGIKPRCRSDQVHLGPFNLVVVPIRFSSDQAYLNGPRDLAVAWLLPRSLPPIVLV
jgi:hypothetical protein